MSTNPTSSTPQAGPQAEPAAASAIRADVDERLYVASVEKAMRVLEAFDKSASELSIADIAQRTGMGRSAAQRFVYTLCQLGYLRRHPAARLYALSTKLVGLVGGMLSANARLQAAYPVLSQLAQETHETVSWVELDGDDIVVLGNVPSEHLASVNLPVGSRFAALPASSGQVLLSQESEDVLRAMLGRLAPAVRARFGEREDDDIIALIEKAREQGYSMTEKNLGQGSVSVSVPVLDHASRVVAAINLSTLSLRYDVEAARRDLLPRVLHTAKVLSAG
ncbi:IclR family transcriptional regulator [Achromobacter aloeverae]